MVKLHQPISIMLMTVLLSACASQCHSPTQMASNLINRQSVVSTSGESYPTKNPQHVALYSTEQSPASPYRVIGVATISKFNLLGVKRQDATMHNMMKQLAANMGGDGVINLSSNDNALQGHIIAFQKILI
jgi:hypothetical protein